MSSPVHSPTMPLLIPLLRSIRQPYRFRRLNLGATQPTPPPPPPPPPQVMVDDLGWNGFGFNSNNTEVRSPAIDELARGGVILVNHYVYKFCSPTRASFLTGRIPGHGIQETNLAMTSAVGCNLNLTMIPKMLKRAGYSSHLVGKWHQGFYRQSYTPAGRGFDSSFGFLGGGADHLSQCHGCENSIPAPDYATQKFSCPARYSPCGVVCPDQGGVDLFCTDRPCVGRNTSADPYVEQMPANRTERVLLMTCTGIVRGVARCVGVGVCGGKHAGRARGGFFFGLMTHNARFNMPAGTSTTRSWRRSSGPCRRRPRSSSIS